MIRQDLLALTVDDLILLSNKGLVKRAQQEIQSNLLNFEIATNNNGDLTIDWSDNVKCTLPANMTITNGQCSCPSTTICRHIIRSVLIYQQEIQNTQESIKTHSTKQETDATKNHKPLLEPWNPGNISDSELTKTFTSLTLNKLKQQFDAGHVIELIKSHKPSAYFHTLACTVQFLVPNDLRYTHCDCTESQPCSHVVLAVWAFRLLNDSQSSGIVSTNKTPLPIPKELLNEIETLLGELIGLGFANLYKAFIDKFRRLETKAREEKLIWPAEIISEIIQHYEFYISHNASFSISKIFDLIGEICVRLDAICNDTDLTPQLFVRGTEKDKITDISSARLIGLGCGVKIHKNNVELSAYSQDVDSGMVVAISQTFNDPPKESTDLPKPFWQLAQSLVIKGTPFNKLGAGQLLIKGGKRTSNYQLIPGRAQTNVNPQTFKWETLRPPVFKENFSEIKSRLNNLPPASLRPKRVAENLQIIPIKQVEQAVFSQSEQLVKATLLDNNDDKLSLLHPFTSRGQEGLEKLLYWLSNNACDLKFVSGQVYTQGSELFINPIALIFEKNNTRFIIQPWIDRLDNAEKFIELSNFSNYQSTDPISFYITEIKEALGEIILIGLNKIDIQTIAYWKQLVDKGMALGLLNFTKPIRKLADSLACKNKELDWSFLASAETILELAVLINVSSV